MSEPVANSNRRSGVRLFSVFDIEIRLDLSVGVIFGLIVYSLANGVFPGWHPTWPSTTTWATALAAGVLFFASLLAHELSHSLVARRYGIRVRRITLFLFGGVAEIESEATTPSSEFAIAIAGPLMSLAIAAACTVTASIVLGAAAIDEIARNPEQGMQNVSPLITVFLWLGSVNFMLALFNMIPGFPLDGGRVFRALVWRITGNQLLATRYASTAGRWFGWSLMAIGLWNLLALKSLGGLWLLLIGWFLSHLAAMSYTQALTQKKLEPLTVADLMRTRFDTVQAEIRVADFIEDCLLRSNQLLWPVLEVERCIGTVSLAEVLSLPVRQRAESSVRDIMIPLTETPSLSATMSASSASPLLGQAGERPLIVIQGAEVVGLLRGADVLKWMLLQGGQATEG